MWRFSLFLFRAVSGFTRWLQRRLTRAGMLVAGMLVTGAVLGVDTNQTVAYKIFALAAGLLGVAALAVILLRDRYHARRFLPRVVTAGEAFRYRVAVTNLNDGPRDGLSLLEDLADPLPGFAELRARFRVITYRRWKRLVDARTVVKVGETPLPRIAPRATIDVYVQGLACRRGSQHFRGLAVARADPLALCKALFTAEGRANLLVLPRRYRMPPIALPGTRKFQPGGITLAASIGDSEEFVGLRDYRPGDPLQRIHWKSFARIGEPVVREYQDEYFERHALVLDTFAPEGGDLALEEAVSVAASYACTVSTQECLLDLMFVGANTYAYTSGRGQLPTANLLEILAGVQPCRDKPFAALSDAVIARRSAISGCIVILLAWDDARADFVARLRASGVPYLAMLVTAQPPSDPPPWLRVLLPGAIEQGLAAL